MAIVAVYGAVFARAPLSSFVPTFSDEVYYFKQAAGFRAAGFGHGYWGAGRATAALGACDTHGCGFMVVTGTFGRLVGWSYAHALFFNLACLGAACLAVLLVPRRRPLRALLILAVLLTCGVVVTYVHAAMQEVLHAAGAVVLAVVAHRVAGTPTRRWLLAYFALGTALSLVRVTWAVYLPLVALLVPRAGAWRRVRLGALGALLAGGALLLQHATIPGASLVSFDGGSPWAALAQRCATNLEHLIAGVEPLYVSFRILWLALLVTPFLRRLRPATDQPGSATLRWAWVALAGLTVLQITLYDCFSWRDYRVMSAPVLAVVIALALMADARPVRALVAVHLLLLPMALSQAQAWNDLRVDREGVAAHERSLGTLLPRVEGALAGSPWCRTVAVVWSQELDYPRLLAIPDGLGVMILRDPADASDHPARFLVTAGQSPPGRRLLGTWQPGLFVYERAAPGCGP